MTPYPVPPGPVGANDAHPAQTYLTGRLWVQRGREAYLGAGRIALLERIRDTGSIAAAARGMRMGYRHAWDLVEQMNRLAPAPLVERITGGRGGGGTRLTLAGVQTIAQFRRAEKSLADFLDTLDPPGVHIDGTAADSDA